MNIKIWLLAPERCRGKDGKFAAGEHVYYAVVDDPSHIITRESCELQQPMVRVKPKKRTR